MNKRMLHQVKVDDCCVWLQRFGYLRPSDVARLLYTGRSSALRMAQRLLATMYSAGLLLRRQDTPVEEAHYALSDAGARHLFDVAEIQAKSGKDLLRNVSGHRDAANEVCITALLEGRHVVTDREIQTHYNGGFKCKVPDALIIDSWNGPGGEGQRDYHWVEVEHSRRHPRDLGTFAHWIVEVAFPERCMRDGVGIGFQDGYLQCVIVVIASQYAATIESRLRDAVSGIASPSQIEWLWRDRLVFKNLLAK